MWPLPIQTLNDELQVWSVRAVYGYEIGTLSSSRWRFVTLRDVGTTQAEMADMWRDQLEAWYCMNRPTNWTLVRLVVEDVFPGTVADHIVEYTPPFNPGPGGPGTPPQVTPVLSWLSGNPGRSYRGRTFWGPVLREHADDGFLNTDGRLAPSLFGLYLTTEFGPTQPIWIPAFAILSRQHDLNGTDPPQWTRPRFEGVDASLRTLRHRQTMPVIRLT